MAEPNPGRGGSGEDPRLDSEEIEAPASLRALPTADRTPSVIVSDLHITYKVYGARKRGVAAGQGESQLLKRALHVGRRTAARIHEVPAIRGVSFVAYRGEAIGLIGRNGSGKSTLLRAISGLMPPTSGAVWVDGEPALLGVNAVLMNSLSGERNVMIGGQALGLTPRQVREAMPEIVEFSGIGDFIHMPMSAYSAGMAARLRFAISTTLTPDILIIDEALSTGDALFKQRSQERIQRIHQDAGTVFLVSHSEHNIRAMCSRALWLDSGRLLMDGPADAVVDAYEESNRALAETAIAKGLQRRPGIPRGAKSAPGSQEPKRAGGSKRAAG